MGKRELKALKAEQKARFDARVAVYKALWETPAYVRMNARLDALNKAVSEATRMAFGDVEGATRRFKRYHRRIQAIERTALIKAGFPNG
jgi:hypothetical protein